MAPEGVRSPLKVFISRCYSLSTQPRGPHVSQVRRQLELPKRWVSLGVTASTLKHQLLQLDLFGQATEGIETNSESELLEIRATLTLE